MVPTVQNTTLTPTTAPTLPKSKGMTTLEKLIVVRRKPMACPCWACGVIWCSVLMIMGCTAPKAMPNTTEHRPIPKAECIKG